MPMNKDDYPGIVYSSEHGKMCPACGRAVAACVCEPTKEIPQGDGIVRVARSTKGRKGKCVTVVTGIPLDEGDLKKLARQLKQKCGAGGTAKNATIEIQGDHRDTLIEELKNQGYTVKRSGG